MTYSTRIGIIGGGQLGRMLTIAAKKLGMTVIVTDPTPNSPAGQVADKQLVGDFKDEKTTQELAELVDVITIDAEFVNDIILEKIEKNVVPVHPSPQTIRVIKDKLRQKEFLSSYKIPTADFVAVNSLEDIKKAGERFGYPFLLKARFDAYDGKGNFLVKNSNDIEKGLEKLKDRKLYVERFVSFTKELAVIVARSTTGDIAVYPVVETVHKNNICDTVIVPAEISSNTLAEAHNLAKKVIECFTGAGVFGIEMFLQKDDTIVVNEIAPRVHNSGHYTIESCITSQFEQHIRAIAGLPLGSTMLIPKAVVMKNILGEKNGVNFPKGLEKALEIQGVSIHMYGKNESRIGRKMGHITVIADTINEALKKATTARSLLIL